MAMSVRTYILKTSRTFFIIEHMLHINKSFNAFNQIVITQKTSCSKIELNNTQQ